MLYYRVAGKRAESGERVESGEWCPLRGQSGLRLRRREWSPAKPERCGKNLPQANFYFIKTIVRDCLSQIVGEEEIKRTEMFIYTHL